MSATSPAVVAIVIANVAVYIAQNLAPAITDRFASYPPAIAQGQWWRLFTPMFLHAPLGSRFSLLHIGFNMFVLWIYGPHVEEVLGSVRFTFLYLLCGVFGNATSYAFGPCNVLGLGASGAIFGVVGILLVILYNRRRSTFVRGFMQNLLVFVGVNLLIGFAIPGVDYWAHLGGLASGVALGAGFDVHAHRRGIAGGLQTATAAGVLGLAIGLVVTRTAGFSC
jgi:rhomboid protease GluP